MPATWTAAVIGFKHCSTETGTYQPLYTTDGSAQTLVEMTVAASGDYVLPDAVFGCAFIKIWSTDGNGSDTNQAGARTFGLNLKG
jgi:hypothetical protein